MANFMIDVCATAGVALAVFVVFVMAAGFAALVVALAQRWRRD